jgi:hypothetical protein
LFLDSVLDGGKSSSLRPGYFIPPPPLPTEYDAKWDPEAATTFRKTEKLVPLRGFDIHVIHFFKIFEQNFVCISHPFLMYRIFLVSNPLMAKFVRKVNRKSRGVSKLKQIKG